MDCLGNELFARTAFACDQHLCIGRRHSLDLGLEIEHRSAGANQRGAVRSESGLFASVVLRVELAFAPARSRRKIASCRTWKVAGYAHSSVLCARTIAGPAQRALRQLVAEPVSESKSPHPASDYQRSRVHPMSGRRALCKEVASAKS